MSFRGKYAGAETNPLLVDAELGDQGRSIPVQSCEKQALSFPDELMLQQENSPAYKVLHDAGLLVHQYRLKSASELELVPGNSTVKSNFFRRVAAYTAGVFVGGVIYDVLVHQFTVKDGCVRSAMHADGRYFFYGPGAHRVNGLFITIGTEDVALKECDGKHVIAIEHGNQVIVTVPQGSVGLAFDRGQPILLVPGLHQWKSDTMKMKELIDLSSDVIRIGPFTLLTVDEGYCAITQDNGKQRVLNGGSTYMLTHRNWKFEKLISLKIHTDDLGPFRATSADNVVLETKAIVNWRVQDATQAARMAADTMQRYAEGKDGEKSSVPVAGVGPTSHLRNDVLKQAIASLAAAIGSIRYSDEVHVAAAKKINVDTADTLQEAPIAPASKDELCGVAQIFSVQQMSGAVQHANEICGQYGISIVSINVISAVPTDKQLEEALSAGAVAAAGAQQAEIAAKGNAKARLIESQSIAAAARIQAQSVADAEVMHAQGKKDAAALLESSGVAIDLAKIEKTGQSIGDKTTFFFGNTPAGLPAMLSYPKCLPDVGKPDKLES